MNQSFMCIEDLYLVLLSYDLVCRFVVKHETSLLSLVVMDVQEMRKKYRTQEGTV
jgi:hypothetical protein